MRRMTTALVLMGGSLLGGGCGGATESAEAAAPAKAKKVKVFVVNGTGGTLDQVGMQSGRARISFDEMRKGDREYVQLPEGVTVGDLEMSWLDSGRRRHHASLSCPEGVDTVTITISASNKATLSAR